MIRRAAFAIGLGLLAVGVGFALRNDPLFSGLATFDNGLIVRYSAGPVVPFADSGMAGWGSSEVISDPETTSTPGIATQKLHRFIVDSAHKVFFGYDLRVVRQSVLMPAGRGGIDKPYQVWIEPLTLTSEDLPERFRKLRPRPMKLRAYPPSRTVGDGDSIVVDLTVAGRVKSASDGPELRETLRFSTTRVRHLPIDRR